MGFAQLVEHRMSDIDVASFVPRSDVVDRARSSFLKCQPDRSAMILDIDPVAHVAAIPIHRNWSVLKRIGNHERQKLLGKLPRAVVISAARYNRIEPEGVVRSPHQMLRCGLGSGIGTIGT